MMSVTEALKCSLYFIFRVRLISTDQARVKGSDQSEPQTQLWAARLFRRSEGRPPIPVTSHLSAGLDHTAFSVLELSAPSLTFLALGVRAWSLCFSLSGQRGV